MALDLKFIGSQIIGVTKKLICKILVIKLGISLNLSQIIPMLIIKKKPFTTMKKNQ